MVLSNDKQDQKRLNNLMKNYVNKKNTSMASELSDLKSSINTELIHLNPKRLKQNSIMMRNIKDYDGFKQKIKKTRGIELDIVAKK